MQEYQRRPSSLTLKWRQRKQGWSRSSTSIPMPVQVRPRPDLGQACQMLLNAALLKDYSKLARDPGTTIFLLRQWVQTPEQQAEAVVQASLTLLKRHLVQPFSLTLLNVGATNFCTAVSRGGQLPKAFSTFFGQAAAAPAKEIVEEQDTAGEMGHVHGVPLNISFLHIDLAVFNLLALLVACTSYGWSGCIPHHKGITRTRICYQNSHPL